MPTYGPDGLPVYRVEELVKFVEHPDGRVTVEPRALCPAHLVPEPCPTCSAYIAAGL